MSSPAAASSQQSRPGLRRATYVHVSDLTSPYNIDHGKLEEELTRVMLERRAKTDPTKSPEGSETEADPAAAASELDSALSTVPPKRLQPPKGGYNLCVLVGKVTIVVDKRRVDQSRVRLAEVEIGDETGTVSLRARDEQIDLLQEVSKRSGAIVLRNCTLELYQGKHIRLAVTKWGKLSTYPDSVPSTPPPPSKMNQDRNFSRIDLSVVASEMVDSSPESTYPNRQSKTSESSEGSTKSSFAKGGQTYGRNQPQTSSRRGGRDRRKGKHGVASSNMRYQAMHPYPMYETGVDMRQYPYHHQQEQVMAPSSAQHLMMQHQYELHHQQMMQMYHHSGARTGQPQTAGGMAQQVVPAASFDASEYQMPSYTPSGSSPILIPAGMTSAQGQGSQGAPSRPYSTDARAGEGAQEAETSTPQFMSVSPDDSHMSHGMNPDATTFAPVFANPPVANPPSSHQIYFPYNPSQSSPGAAYPPPQSHPGLYPGGMMYAPSPGSGPGSSQDPQDTSGRGQGKPSGPPKSD